MVQKTKLYTRQTAISEATQLVYAFKFNKALNLVKKYYTATSYEYLFFKGWICQLKNETKNAVKWFEKSLQKNPLSEYSLEGLVGCYIQLNQLALALECAEQLISVSSSAKTLFVLATAQSHYYRGDKPKLQEVPSTFNSAYSLALEENDLALLKDILIGWGACLVDLQQFEEARVVLETVQLQEPNSILIHKNLASVYAGLNLTDKAIESCNIAKLSDDPNIANDALYQLGMLLLSKGDYNPGWRLHEFRHKLKAHDYKPTDKIPFWTGKVLSGESDRLLLYQEQGLGDTIQFSRYIREVKKRVKHVDLLLHANTYVPWQDSTKEPNSLKTLISENYPELDSIYIRGWDNIAYDKYTNICSLMSLPRVFKTTLSNIPSIPYLQTYKESSITVSDIGIFWRGSAAHANDKNRSIPTSLINSFISSNKDRSFTSLQIDRDEDLEEHENLVKAKPFINDFTDTLSVLKRCRLVITVDSMIAHLAGSANIPTIVLHANSADWRWLIKRRDSPWYPSIINLHQDDSKNWNVVLDAVQREIKALFDNEILID